MKLIISFETRTLRNLSTLSIFTRIIIIANIHITHIAIKSLL